MNSLAISERFGAMRFWSMKRNRVTVRRRQREILLLFLEQQHQHFDVVIASLSVLSTMLC